MKKLKLKVSKTEQGFTIFEVLVAMLIVTGFLFASLQLMVIATVFKVKSSMRAIGDDWIDTDLEEVHLIASKVPRDDIKCSATTYDAGYAKALSDQLAPHSYDSFTNVLNPQQYDVDQKRSGTIQRKLRLTRSYPSYASTELAPYKLLRIQYEVQELDSNDNPVLDQNGDTVIVAQEYTEVIPDEAFKCP